MPDIVTDGMLVAGDAAGLTLAAGIWLEGVNFAIGSGAAAGETAVQALARGDVTAAGLQGYRTRLEQGFVLADHRKLRRVPLAPAVRAGAAPLPGDGVPTSPRSCSPSATRRRSRAWAASGGTSCAGPGCGCATSPATPGRHGGAMAEPTEPAARVAAEPIPSMSFEDRMATVEFRIAPDAHIVVDGDSCRGCTTRACVHVCPANLFAPTADGGILFNYEECFECGSCYLVCNEAGAITWTYPEGGHGVVFHRS